MGRPLHPNRRPGRWGGAPLLGGVRSRLPGRSCSGRQGWLRARDGGCCCYLARPRGRWGGEAGEGRRGRGTRALDFEGSTFRCWLLGLSARAVTNTVTFRKHGAGEGRPRSRSGVPTSDRGDASQAAARCHCGSGATLRAPGPVPGFLKDLETLLVFRRPWPRALPRECKQFSCRTVSQTGVYSVCVSTGRSVSPGLQGHIPDGTAAFV